MKLSKLLKREKNIEQILNGNIYTALFSLAIPVMINSFLHTMYNLTDTFWLGRLGTDELAAINLVSPVQSIVVNFGSGITVAGSVLIARYVGAKRNEEARKMANQIFACAMIFAVVCASLLAVLTPSIVSWLGADGNIKLQAIKYLQLVILDMPFLYIVNIYASVNQAQGDTVRPMLLNFSGIIINMIADPLLIVACGLGVSGAALATVFAKAIPASIAFTLLNKKRGIVYLELKKLKFEKDKLSDILRVGLPSAIGGSTMQFGFLLMSKNVLEYGSTAVAAYGIGNKVNGLITLPVNGIGSAVATIVGQNMGAGNKERAKGAYIRAMIFAIVFLLAGGLILSRQPIAKAIVSVFTEDENVIKLATQFFSIMALWCFTNGVYNPTLGLFQGTGHTEVTMAIDVMRLWVFRFSTLYVCESILNMGVESIWYSVVISNGLSAFCLFAVYLTGYWKKERIKH